MYFIDCVYEWKMLDDWTKVAGLGAGLVGGGFALWKYLQTARIEGRKPFLSKQLEFYVEVCGVVSELCTTKDLAVRAKAEGRFWQLYYGQLAVFETPEVEQSMISIGNLLRRSDNLKWHGLKKESVRLAHACRDSIASSWSIRLASLPDKPISDD